MLEKLPRVALHELQAPGLVKVVFLEQAVEEEVPSRDRRDDGVDLHAGHERLGSMRDQVLGVRIPAATQDQHVTYGDTRKKHAIVVTRVREGEVTVRVIV